MRFGSADQALLHSAPELLSRDMEREQAEGPRGQTEDAGGGCRMAVPPQREQHRL